MSAALAIREDLLRELPTLIQQMPEPAKVIAFKVGTTPRAVEAHRQQEQLPRLDVALAYARLYPEVKKLLTRLMYAEMGDADESPNQVLAKIAQLVQGRAG
jgi:hypothetical protein